MNNRICLAVSNCKEYWDTNSKLAFISDSIPDYHDAEELESINPIILNGPWKSREYRIKSHQFVVERVTRYRKELSSELNLGLNVSLGEKAWGILLDSWLLHFTSVIYDRVNKLENAKEQLGSVFLKCLKENNPSVLTTFDFVGSCNKDKFNQFLFCDVAKAVGISVEYCSDPILDSDLTSKDVEGKILKNKPSSLFLPLINSLFGWWIQYRKPLIIADGFFPLKNAIEILLRSLGRVLIIPSRFFLESLPDLKKNPTLRKSLHVSENDKYDMVANKLLEIYFPLSLLEGFVACSRKMSRLERTPVLGSAGGFFQNEEYKILASRVIENGNKIIGFQHGGNYNFQKNEFRCSEYFEKLNGDKFYRWKERSFSGDFLPSTKLEKLASCKEVIRTRGSVTNILFVSQRFTRFIFRYEAENSDDFSSKIIDQQNFYSKLDKTFQKFFLLRPYPTEFGWRYKKRWLDFTGGNIRFDPTPQFYKSLESSRVYATDHISTTWLEALFSGIPVILFFDIEQYFVLDEVRGLFVELQNVGIFHPTAESAAAFLNANYENIEDWWEDSATKTAADKIKDYFYTASDNFSKEWTKELLTLRNNALKNKI